jgi:hypothetical protein
LAIPFACFTGKEADKETADKDLLCQLVFE